MNTARGHRPALPKYIPYEHRHAYYGGGYSHRNGYSLTDNPYETPAYAEAWRRGFVDAARAPAATQEEQP